MNFLIIGGIEMFDLLLVSKFVFILACILIAAHGLIMICLEYIVYFVTFWNSVLIIFCLVI